MFLGNLCYNVCVHLQPSDFLIKILHPFLEIQEKLQGVGSPGVTCFVLD